MKDPHFAADDRPCLAGKARLRDDPTRGAVVLLYPEGVLMLNPTAAAVLALCDGRRNLAAIVSELGARFQAAPGVVTAEVTELLDRLRQGGLIGVTSDGDSE